MDSYSKLYDRGFFFPGNDGVGEYFANACIVYGNNLTALGIHANSGVLTVPAGTSGANDGFRVFGPDALVGQTTKGGYILEMTANVTAPVTTTEDMLGNIAGSSGAVSLRMQTTGKVFVRFVDTDNTGTNSTASDASHAGSEVHFAVVYSPGDFCKAFADGAEVCSLDISEAVVTQKAIDAVGFGCAHGSASNPTVAAQIRRMGFIGFPGALPSDWPIIVQAMNAAKAGNLPITYKA